MAKINGTSVLLYADGTVVALQRGLTINAEQDLPDATTKMSLGWAEHINGLRNATISFDALYSTTGLSAEDLLTYITGRTSLLMLIVGGITFPIISEVDLSSISLVGNREEPGSLTGNLKVNGKLYQLKGASESLITDPDGSGETYDTFDTAYIAISSAIIASGSASANSNTFSVTSGDIIKLAVFVTSTSGELPIVEIRESGAGAISNIENLVAGLNIVTLTVTATKTAYLTIRNTGAANWAMSNIYLFKDPN